jgi:hypothetical protein
MLLFRSEEHVECWCQQWNQPRGEIFSLEQGWGMAQAWYSQDRREAQWRRRTAEEAEVIFTGLGLTSSFWKLA